MDDCIRNSCSDCGEAGWYGSCLNAHETWNGLINQGLNKSLLLGGEWTIIESYFCVKIRKQEADKSWLKADSLINSLKWSVVWASWGIVNDDNCIKLQMSSKLSMKRVLLICTLLKAIQIKTSKAINTDGVVHRKLYTHLPLSCCHESSFKILNTLKSEVSFLKWNHKV